MKIGIYNDDSGGFFIAKSEVDDFVNMSLLEFLAHKISSRVYDVSQSRLRLIFLKKTSAVGARVDKTYLINFITGFEDMQYKLSTTTEKLK